MDYRELKVANANVDETIASFLRKNGISSIYLTKLRKKLGYILLNGEVSKTNEKVKSGDLISIESNPAGRSSIGKCIIPLDIVFENEDLLIINKPSGLATMPTRSVYSNNLSGAVMNYMQEKQPEFVCRIIGRLDKFVSGLVVVAKNAFCASYLNCHMSEIQKTYYALVGGKIDKPQRIDKNIMTICENGINVQKRICDENGKSAITNVFPIKSNNNFSIVKLLIENGRTHQIRVHLSSENHPIVGDLLYGGTTYQSDRVCLHCGQILLPMPGGDKRSVFAADMPKEFLTYANLE